MRVSTKRRKLKHLSRARQNIRESIESGVQPRGPQKPGALTEAARHGFALGRVPSGARVAKDQMHPWTDGVIGGTWIPDDERTP